MRKDRFVLAALAVVVTFVEVGHHLYEHHLLQRTVAAAPQQLRGSVDFGQGYGERAAASAIAAAAGVIADAAVTPAAAGTAAHEQIALLQGELDRLKAENENGKLAAAALQKKNQEAMAGADAATDADGAKAGAALTSPPPPPSAWLKQCKDGGMFYGEDIQGSDISVAVAASVRACCQRCARHQRGGGECTGWTYAPTGGASGQCYLKAATEPRAENVGVTSGSSVCCEAFDPPAVPPQLQVPAAGGSAAAITVAKEASDAEICTMTAWWGGVRVKGEQMIAAKVASPEECCDLCADEAGGACVGWTFNSQDHHCQGETHTHNLISGIFP